MREVFAQKIKEKIEILENYQSRSTIVNPNISNVSYLNNYIDNLGVKLGVL